MLKTQNVKIEMMTRHIGSLYDPPDTVTRPLGSCTAMTSILGFRVALGGIVGAGVRPVYHDKPTNVRIRFRKFHQNLRFFRKFRHA